MQVKVCVCVFECISVGGWHTWWAARRDSPLGDAVFIWPDKLQEYDQAQSSGEFNQSCLESLSL